MQECTMIAPAVLFQINSILSFIGGCSKVIPQKRLLGPERSGAARRCRPSCFTLFYPGRRDDIEK